MKRLFASLAAIAFALATTAQARVVAKPIDYQHEDARRLAEKAENVRRADIPAADRANVNPLGPGHKITRGNGTEQIGPDRHSDVADEVHGVNVGAPTSRFQEES